MTFWLMMRGKEIEQPTEKKKAERYFVSAKGQNIITTHKQMFNTGATDY